MLVLSLSGVALGLDARLPSALRHALSANWLVDVGDPNSEPASEMSLSQRRASSYRRRQGQDEGRRTVRPEERERGERCKHIATPFHGSNERFEPRAGKQDVLIATMRIILK